MDFFAVFRHFSTARFIEDDLNMDGHYNYGSRDPVHHLPNNLHIFKFNPTNYRLGGRMALKLINKFDHRWRSCRVEKLESNNQLGIFTFGFSSEYLIILRSMVKRQFQGKALVLKFYSKTLTYL